MKKRNFFGRNFFLEENLFCVCWYFCIIDWVHCKDEAKKENTRKIFNKAKERIIAYCHLEYEASFGSVSFLFFPLSIFGVWVSVTPFVDPVPVLWSLYPTGKASSRCLRVSCIHILPCLFLGTLLHRRSSSKWQAFFVTAAECVLTG